MQIPFHLNIKHLRKLRNLSQLELASQLNVTNSLISSIEGGRSLPSFQLLIDIAEFFNINLNDLVYTDLSKPGLKISDLKNPEFNQSGYDSNKIVFRLESMLTQLEERIKKECPECAKKLGL
jgi:transcriptional regulator with XRE-family HTH domain